MSIRGTEAHWAHVPPDLARRLKARTARIGDALLTSLGGSRSLRMNRVLGLGHRGRARAADVDRILAHYRDAGVKRFSVSLGPVPQARRIARWLLARGFTMKPGLALLVRDARLPVVADPHPFRVRRATAADAPAIVRLHARAFGMPASRRRWNLASAASEDIEHWLALSGRTLAAAGALRVDGRLAWLGGGATAVRFRKLGAHRALIAARLERARRRGCRWVWVQTLAPGRGRPDGSRRNMLHHGFEPVGLEPTFVWGRR
jgi:hypothetical protein